MLIVCIYPYHVGGEKSVNPAIELRSYRVKMSSM